MAEIIKDGTGTGQTMKVDENNRAHVQAVTIDVALIETINNNAYDVSTGGLVELTDATDTALLYIKNDGDDDLIINTIFIDSEASTGGTGSGSLHFHLNPTTGTLISDAVAAQVLNRRIGSPVGMSSTQYKASANGKTLTDGDEIRFPLSDNVGIALTKPFVIPKGQAFGVTYVPPTGNTSMNISIGLLIIQDTTV